MTAPYLPPMGVRDILGGGAQPPRVPRTMGLPHEFFAALQQRSQPKQQQQGLWQRFTGGLRDTLSPVPDELKHSGLFDPETIRGMQRASLMRGTPVTEQMKDVLGFREYKDGKAQQQSMAQRRAEVFAKYPIPPNATMQQLGQIQAALQLEFEKLGDTDMVGKISQSTPSYIKATEGPKAEDPVKYSPEWFKGYEQEKALDLKYRPPPAASGTNPNAARIDRLAGQYERAVKEAQEQYDQIGNTINYEVPKALNRDGAAQYAVIVQFVKALDPGSVAREGEVALTRQAQSMWEEAQAGLARVQSGGLVGPELIQKMSDLMAQRRKSYLAKIQRTQQQYRTRAQSPNDLDATFYAPTPDAPAAAAPPPAGGKLNRYAPKP